MFHYMSIYTNENELIGRKQVMILEKVNNSQRKVREKVKSTRSKAHTEECLTCCVIMLKNSKNMDVLIDSMGK
jgi:hypothetical protein